MQKKTNSIIMYKPYTLETIFKEAFFKQIDSTMNLEEYLRNHYEINSDTQFGFFGIYLGKTYEEDYPLVQKGLKTFSIEGLDMNREVLNLPSHKLVLAVLYPMVAQSQYQYFQNKVQNELSLFTPESSIFIAQRCTGIDEFSHTLECMMKQLHWNLVLGSRVLINESRLNTLPIETLKYPIELDGLLEKSILQKDLSQFEHCFKKLQDHCRTQIHTPDDLKSICMRYTIFIAHIARINNEALTLLALEKTICIIVNAIYWRDIWNAILEFSLSFLRATEKEQTQSLLVINTKKLIRQYYGSGITLEEISHKLHVSEEYLSALFKKETGSTFSETIRHYRIEKIKELLTTSNLKISEIAKLAGYSDGKYMSRVFKEEVGMSPLQYRETRSA